MATGVLYRLTDLIIKSFNLQTGQDAPDILKVITEPLTKNIIQVNHFIYYFDVSHLILLHIVSNYEEFLMALKE